MTLDHPSTAPFTIAQIDSHQLLESLPDCVKILDLEGRLCYMNESGQRLLGIDNFNDYQGRTWTDFWQGNDQQAAIAAIAAAKSGGHGKFQGYCPNLSGVPHWWDVDVSPIRNAQGKIEQLLSVSRNITHLKQTEQQLQLFADVVHTTQIGIVVWQLETANDPSSFRLLIANAAASEITAVNFQALIGQTMATCFPNLLQTSLVQQYLQVIQTQQPIDLGEISYGTDGIQAGTYTLKAFPLPNQCIGLAFENVTVRKALETALSEREQRLTIATEAAQLGIFEWRIPEDITVWENDRLYEMFGRSPEDGSVSAQDFFDNYLYPDDAAILNANLTQAMQTGSLRQTSYRIRRQDGTIRWLEVSGQVEFAEDGSPLRLIGVDADITDRKQAEMELQASEARFRNMADNAPMMVWVTNPVGYCTYLNQSWYDFTGQTEAIGLGFGWLDATHPDDRAASEAIFLAANQRHEGFQLEYRLRCRDGQYRTCIDAAKPWFGTDGTFKGYIGSVIDIDDRKRAETEREQLLQREQIAREAAETANQIKDEFLAVLSHELRSPLNPILGWAKLLQQGNLDAARTKTALATIERNAQLQAQLIDDLLDISRILRGKLSLDAAPVDLRRVIAAALETVHLAAEAKSLSVQTALPASGEIVVGDAGRLQQVVWNLLSNAVKFTPPSGRITVSLTQSENYAQIQVSDTGKGIAPDFLPFVFEHFRQEDGATTRKFGGLGLGLAIARQIVELHGGQISVDSLGEGQGTTFTVQLPLASQSSQLPTAAPTVIARGDLQDICIWVVDDELDSREFVTFVLEQAGAIVTCISSGIEALQAIEQGVPDVIVSDIGMPEMDGYMLMQQVRELEQGRTISAIALTAYAGEFDRQQALKAGFQQHLSKPIDPDELIQEIARLVEGSGYN